ANLQWELDFFRFQDFRAGSSQSSGGNEDRPLATLENKPPYLEHARRNLSTTNEQQKIIFALLLAQHGDFDGVDHLVAQQPEGESEKYMTTPDALLAGIGLSRDAKYLPFLRRLMQRTQQDYELRKILRAAKGMSGPEIRQLRMDVNKRMRTASASNVSVD